MSKIGQIRTLVENGLFYLSEHATDEAWTDGFDIYDVEHAMIHGRLRRTWPSEGKYEVVGASLDGRTLGIVCRITVSRKVRVITVYEDRPRS